MKKDLIKEFVNVVVEEVLQENPMRLRDIFLNPAKDVAQTFSYGAERISAAAQSTLKGISILLPTLIIPGLEFDYESFAHDEQQKLDQIKKKYGDVLARNWEAIKDPDVFGFLFLAYPQSMLGYALLKKSPIAFLRLLEVMTGGMHSVSSLRQSLEQTSAYSPRQRQNFDPAGGSWGAAGGAYGDYGGSWGGDYGNAGAAFESVLREAQPQAQNQTTANNSNQSTIINQIMALMKQPDVQQALQNSPMVADMKRAALDIMVAPVVRVFQIKTLDQMKSVIKPEAIEKAKQAVLTNPEFKQLSPEDKKKAEAQLLQQIKNIYRDETVKFLTNQISKQPNSGPVVQAAIAKIKSIK